MGIGIEPVTVSDYLSERPYLIFQSTPTKVEASDEPQWAGDLGSNFSRMLGTGLGCHMGKGNIRQYPWEKESELRYQITVDVNRLHGRAEGDGFEKLAEAQSRLVDQLARVIAGELK